MLVYFRNNYSSTPENPENSSQKSTNELGQLFLSTQWVELEELAYKTVRAFPHSKITPMVYHSESLAKLGAGIHVSGPFL